MSEGWQSLEHIPLTTDARVTFPDIWAMFSTHSSLLLPLISMTFLYLFPRSLLFLGTKSVTGVGSQWTLNPVICPALFPSLSFSMSHKKLTQNWKTAKHYFTPFSYILTVIQWLSFKRKLLEIISSELEAKIFISDLFWNQGYMEKDFYLLWKCTEYSPRMETEKRQTHLEWVDGPGWIHREIRLTHFLVSHRQQLHRVNIEQRVQRWVIEQVCNWAPIWDHRWHLSF